MTKNIPAKTKAPAAPARKTPAKTAQRATSKAPSTAATAPLKAPVKSTKPVTAKADKKKEKVEKVKVVRDSFTIPKTEYTQIAVMKKRAMDLGLEIKKSELIRAGLLLLSQGSDAAFRKALSQVPTLKTGRPGKA